MTKQADDIEVPANAFVPCPDLNFKNVRVRNRCAGCPEFRGIMDCANPAAPLEAIERLDFETRYRIICAKPIARRAMMVEE